MMRLRSLAMVLTLAALAGCGTTRWSDTQRTATEQLLISDAIDRAVSELDFSAIAHKTVYLDTSAIKQTIDAAYLISTLRQHLLATGCTVKDKPDQADYVVEVRTGAMGTDRRELLFGVPATKLPVGSPAVGVPASIPEIALATKTEQRAVAKLAVFAYNRHTGRPIWQSGVIPVESKVKDIWILGAGPFQRGNIYRGTSFAGQKVKLPMSSGSRRPDNSSLPSVAKEQYFLEGEEMLADEKMRATPADATEGVKPAVHAAPVGGPAPEAVPPSVPAPPGPSGMSSHHSSGKSYDLSGLEEVRSALSARRKAESEPKPEAEKAK